MAKPFVVAFKACEEVTITGYQKDCECSHCGRGLKLGVKFDGFMGAFGADCVAKAAKIQVASGYRQKLSTSLIKDRAIIAQKGAKYAFDVYGWKLDGPVFKITLKSDLKSM